MAAKRKYPIDTGILMVLAQLLVASALLTASISSVLAGDPCTCRANGIDVEEGNTACLITATGPRLARCEKVLNNTSWKFLDGPCPTAKLSQATEGLPSIDEAPTRFTE